MLQPTIGTRRSWEEPHCLQTGGSQHPRRAQPWHLGPHCYSSCKETPQARHSAPISSSDLIVSVSFHLLELILLYRSLCLLSLLLREKSRKGLTGPPKNQGACRSCSAKCTSLLSSLSSAASPSGCLSRQRRKRSCLARSTRAFRHRRSTFPNLARHSGEWRTRLWAFMFSLIIRRHLEQLFV